MKFIEVVQFELRYPLQPISMCMGQAYFDVTTDWLQNTVISWEFTVCIATPCLKTMVSGVTFTLFPCPMFCHSFLRF